MNKSAIEVLLNVSGSAHILDTSVEGIVSGLIMNLITSGRKKTIDVGPESSGTPALTEFKMKL